MDLASVTFSASSGPMANGHSTPSAPKGEHPVSHSVSCEAGRKTSSERGSTPL